MAKPSVLTRLEKGKAIGAFPGLVDTWNYIVDFVGNLRGDGDDDKAKGVIVDRSVEDHPVIRLSDDYAPGGGGGGDITVTGTDGSTATGSKLSFASASDSAVGVHVSKDAATGIITATISVHWKT